MNSTCTQIQCIPCLKQRNPSLDSFSFVRNKLDLLYYNWIQQADGRGLTLHLIRQCIPTDFSIVWQRKQYYSPLFWQLIINKWCVRILFPPPDTSIALLLTFAQIPYKKGKACGVCFLLFLNNGWRLKETSLENLSILLANNAGLDFNGMSYIGLPQLPHFLSMRSMPCHDR